MIQPNLSFSGYDPYTCQSYKMEQFLHYQDYFSIVISIFQTKVRQWRLIVIVGIMNDIKERKDEVS